MLWNFGEKGVKNEFISSGDMCVKNHNALLVSAIVTTRLVHFRPLEEYKTRIQLIAYELIKSIILAKVLIQWCVMIIIVDKKYYSY